MGGVSTFAARLGFEFRLPRPPVLLLLVLIDLAACGVDVVTGTILLGTRDWWRPFGWLLIVVAGGAFVLGTVYGALILYTWRLGISHPRPSRREWRMAAWNWAGTLWLLLYALLLARG